MVSLTYSDHAWTSVPVIGTTCIQRWHNRFSQLFSEPVCTSPQGERWVHIHGPLPLLTQYSLNLALDHLSGADLVWIRLAECPFGVFAGKGKPPESVDQWSREAKHVIGDPLELSPLDSKRARSALTQIEHARVRSLISQCDVFFHDLDSLFIDESVLIQDGCEIEPHVTLRGQTSIKAGSSIGFGCQITNCEIDENVTVKPYSVMDSASVGKGASIGPFAHIRPKSKLGANTKVGNFVETKNIDLGNESKASHLAYLGDATIGQDCNIGAGVITCNYDGYNKHRTEIGDRVFIGSDSQLVAPVKVGSDSFVAAGSSITFDVPEQSLGVARSRQVNKEGFAESIRQRAQKLKEENSK